MNQAHIKIWVAIIAAAFFLNPFFRTPEQMTNFVREESVLTIKVLGESWGGMIVRKSIDLFRTAPVQMTYLIFEESSQMQISNGPIRAFNNSMGMQIASAMMNKLMGGWGAMLYIMCIRLMIVLSWVILLAPMLIAAVMDGVSQRKIKFLNYQEIRPTAFTALSFVVIPFAMTPLFYLVAPFSITPTVMPALASAMLLPISWLLANSQPMFADK